MIVSSTPSSISCEIYDGKVVRFLGEWTLEPKFYLDLPDELFWEPPHSKIRLNPEEMENALQQLLKDATARKWVIKISKS